MEYEVEVMMWSKDGSVKEVCGWSIMEWRRWSMLLGGGGGGDMIEVCGWWTRWRCVRHFAFLLMMELQE